MMTDPQEETKALTLVQPLPTPPPPTLVRDEVLDAYAERYRATTTTPSTPAGARWHGRGRDLVRGIAVPCEELGTALSSTGGYRGSYYDRASGTFKKIIDVTLPPVPQDVTAAPSPDETQLAEAVATYVPPPATPEPYLRWALGELRRHPIWLLAVIAVAVPLGLGLGALAGHVLSPRASTSHAPATTPPRPMTRLGVTTPARTSAPAAPIVTLSRPHGRPVPRSSSSSVGHGPATTRRHVPAATVPVAPTGHPRHGHRPTGSGAPSQPASASPASPQPTRSASPGPNPSHPSGKPSAVPNPSTT